MQTADYRLQGRIQKIQKEGNETPPPPPPTPRHAAMKKRWRLKHILKMQEKRGPLP